ncbi:MAG: hypothetical protein IJI12_08085 [Atopobiaceae bacterium]|nr:hypothetical protein [Atopobiaceae bacterium]
MRATISVMAQSIAMLIYIVCLVGSLLDKRRAVMFSRVLHLGSFALCVAVTVADGHDFSRAIMLFGILSGLVFMDFCDDKGGWIISKSETALHEALEVTILMTSVARSLVSGPWAAALGLIACLAFSISSTVIVLVEKHVYDFLTRYCGFPMLVLASITVGSCAVLMANIQPAVHLAWGMYVPLADVPLLMAFLALSGTRDLYHAGLHDIPKTSRMAVMLLPAATACALTNFGELALGIGFAAATCLIMRGAGWSRQQVLTSAAIGVVALIILFLTHPFAARRWLFWFFDASHAETRALLRETPLSGPLWWGGGVASVTCEGLAVRHSLDFGLSQTLSVYGLPGIVCLVAVALCTIVTGAKSLLDARCPGMMQSFLCLVWGIELVGALLAAFGLSPMLSTHGLPFLGICESLFMPLIPALGYAIATYCDQINERIAEEEALADRGAIVLRVADEEESGE